MCISFSANVHMILKSIYNSHQNNAFQCHLWLTLLRHTLKCNTGQMSVSIEVSFDWVLCEDIVTF